MKSRGRAILIRSLNFLKIRAKQKSCALPSPPSEVRTRRGRFRHASASNPIPKPTKSAPLMTRMNCARIESRICGFQPFPSYSPSWARSLSCELGLCREGGEDAATSQRESSKKYRPPYTCHHDEALVLIAFFSAVVQEASDHSLPPLWEKYPIKSKMRAITAIILSTI